MADRPTQGAERNMDDNAREMQRELDEVGEHLDEAKAKAPDARLDKKLGGRAAAGDVSEQEGGPMFGQDAEGAVDEDRE